MYEADVIQRNEFWVGYTGLWGDIPCICSCVPEIICAMPWALLTRIDGGGGAWLGNLFPAYAAENLPQLVYRILADGNVLMTGSDFYTMALRDDLVSDFAEVWFFDEPPAAAPPPHLGLTSEREITNEKYQPHYDMVLQWAAEAEVKLGLGDGCGINFIASDEATALTLMACLSADADTDNAP
jgi:hypothetical protein